MRTVILSNPSPAHLLQLLDEERKHGPVEIIGQAPALPKAAASPVKRRVGRPRKFDTAPAATTTTQPKSRSIRPLRQRPSVKSIRRALKS